MSIFPSYLNLWFLIYVLNSRGRQTYLLARLSGYSPPRICILFSGRRRISQEGSCDGRMGVQEPGCAGTQAGFAKHVCKPPAHGGDPSVSPRDNKDEKKLASRQDTICATITLSCSWSF